MIKLTRTSDLRLDEYEERVSSCNYILVDKEKMKLIYKYEESRMETNRSLARRVLQADSGGSIADMSSNSIIYFLQKFKNCSESTFRNKKTKGMSLDAKKVLIPLYSRGIAEEFLGYYMMYNSLKSKCSRINKLLPMLVDEGDVSNDGGSLHRLYYRVEQQQNLRYNYNSSDIISIPTDYRTSFSCEDGYVLAWGDLKQSDFRIAYNLFIRNEQNAVIMDACDDKYEGIARVLAAFEKIPFDQEKFRQERDLYKLNVLETIYGRDTGKTEKENQFIQRFKRYLATCPRYQEFIQRIKDRDKLGIQFPIRGYFDYVETVENRRSEKDNLNKCLNTPIQMGTSQIVILLVHKVLDMFYSLGYTKDDVQVYIVRHDEPIFKISKRAMKDAWILKEVSVAVVDNWTPIELEFDYGYNYKVPSEEVREMAEKSFVENADKISVVEPDSSAEPYMPLPRTLMFNVGVEEIGGEVIASIYDSKNNEVTYQLIKDFPEGVDKMEFCVKSACQTLMENSEKFVEQDARGVVIYNNYVVSEHFHQGVFYRLDKKYNPHTATAGMFSHWAAVKYSTRLKRENPDLDLDFIENLSLLDLNKNLLESARPLSVLQG